MSERIPVTFEPSGSIGWVERGSTILKASAEAGLILQAPCGSRGICGGCGVYVVSGDLEPPDDEEARGLLRAPEGVRLACRARVAAPVTVRPVVASSAVRPQVRAGGQTAPTLAAVDLGTTTVSAIILDADDHRELGRAATANRQTFWGADVLSRLSAALDGAAGDLRQAAEFSILDVLSAACERADREVDSIVSLVIAGNTAMASLLIQVDVSALAVYPFEAPFSKARGLAPESPVADAIAQDARCVVLPPIASFVGGDTRAALIATGALDAGALTLLVDLGTNAEVALASDDGLWVTSAAAGPAFEAAGIRCGGPAIPGGVVGASVREQDVVLTSIESSEPLWVTGSGLVSVLDLLRTTGHADRSGLMTQEGPLAAHMSSDREGVLGIDLARGPESCLRVDQRDVRAFQLAKAAVRVAIDSVLDAAGVSPEAVERTYLAGAFGSALDPSALVRLGVLPNGMDRRAQAVGDAALLGARVVAERVSLLEQVGGRIGRARHVDLATDPRFNDRLVAALTLAPSAHE